MTKKCLMTGTNVELRAEMAMLLQSVISLYRQFDRPLHYTHSLANPEVGHC